MKTIEQTYQFDASPQTVFDHLTKSELLDTWWTTGNQSEEKVGGAYRYEFNVTDAAKAEGKEDHFQAGGYSVFEPAQALAYNWDCGADSLVRFDFEANGDGCTLKLTHSNIPDNDEVYGMLAGGWEFFLQNLVSVISGGPDNRAAFGLAIPA